MKAESLDYGKVILTNLNEIREIDFKGLEKDSLIKGETLRELLKYLVKKDYILWKSALFINEHHISDDEIKLSHKGMEVVLGKREYFDETEKATQTIHNQTNVTNSSQVQVAQTGDNSQVSQIIDNSQINVLKKLIEEDEDLDEPKKKKLLDILEKFNTLKEGGENALELIKKVGGIALKYVPLFFSLLK
ncbi:MAG: hypothetical protein Q8N99_00280 [Nanoarchaeota archaeon]|nr:hypothetical protein [Nanoarchaeota archaeon]